VKDDYLWDRSGEPDPEVAHLEQLLGRYRHDAPLSVASMEAAPRRRRRWSLALAASILIAAGLATLFATRFVWRPGTPWNISRVEGRVTVDGKPIDDADRLAVNEVLRTDSSSRVMLQLARVGEVEVGPDSELKLVNTESRRHRVSLERGTLTARLWAPPFTFGVRTRAGLASDIGCAFTLTYANGRGLVHVTNGWVDFDGVDSETLVPRGAVAELRDEVGAGSPYYPDAAPQFITALRAFDFDRDRTALPTILATARRRDALTLIHLLEHARPRDERAAIFARLHELAPPPPSVTAEAILARDGAAIHAWRESLGLGGVKNWWVHWRDGIPTGKRAD
jgi:hypothetical protein